MSSWATRNAACWNFNPPQDDPGFKIVYDMSDEEVERKLKERAKKKGFKSIDEYLNHLSGKTPGLCEEFYDQFQKCVRTGCSETLTDGYRDVLVSTCEGVWDGKSLQFPKNSRLGEYQNGRSSSGSRCFGSKETFEELEKKVMENVRKAGFKTLEEYQMHNIRTDPSICRNFYRRLKQCSPNWKRGEDCMSHYRDILVSLCDAKWDGKSLQFPDGSPLGKKGYQKVSK